MKFEERKNVLNSYPKSCKWLNIYSYVFLPLFIIFSIPNLIDSLTYISEIISDPYRTPSMFYGYGYAFSELKSIINIGIIVDMAFLITSIIAFCSCALSISKLGYKSNLILLILFPIKHMITSIICFRLFNVLTTDILFWLMLSSVFSILNYIYFKKRESLFFPNKNQVENDSIPNTSLESSQNTHTSETKQENTQANTDLLDSKDMFEESSPEKPKDDNKKNASIIPETVEQKIETNTNSIDLQFEKISTPPEKDNSKSSAVFVADELLKFKQLLDMGAITQEEFEKKKTELLDL